MSLLELVRNRHRRGDGGIMSAIKHCIDAYERLTRAKSKPQEANAELAKLQAIADNYPKVVEVLEAAWRHIEYNGASTKELDDQIKQTLAEARRVRGNEE